MSPPFLQRSVRLVAPLVSLAAILLLWVAAIRIGQVPSMLLPPPSETARAFVDAFRTGEIWPHLLATLNGAALGYLAGSLLALASAAFFAIVPVAERFLMLHVLAFQAIPKVALAPLIFIWCGFGMASTLTLVAMACFYPVFVNAHVGFRAADPNLIALYRAFGSSRLSIFRSVQLPSAAGQIFVGLEVSVVFALISAVVMEFIAGTEGLGYLIQASSVTLNTAGAFAALFLLALIGIGASSLVKAIRKRLVFWERRSDELLAQSGHA